MPNAVLVQATATLVSTTRSHIVEVEDAQGMRPLLSAHLAARAWALLSASGALFLLPGHSSAALLRQSERPNIVIYMTEDLSPRTGFAGDDVASTPNLDAFAKRAVHLSNVFSVYAVCSPSRSSFTTMRYPFTYGAHNHRTSAFPGHYLNGTRARYLTVPAPGIKAFPEILRRNGYWTFSGPKCDMQFSEYYCSTAPQSIWSATGTDKEAFWRRKARGDTRPFMGQLGDFTTHESQIFPNSNQPDVLNRLQMVKRVRVPPFYKDTPTMRNDLASWYNNIHIMDGHFGRIVKKLEEDHLMQDTIVIWMSDHGDGLPRGKRDLFDYGIHVPCLIWIPKRFQPHWWPAPGSKLDRMVSFLDFGPSLLDLAGVEVPNGIHGQSLFGSKPRRDYVFGAKDRIGNMMDRVRYVRSKAGYKLIRNLIPWLPAGGRDAYSEKQRGSAELHRLFRSGLLDEAQARYFRSRDPEEFYDLNVDPLELNNLVNSTSSTHKSILTELRAALKAELARVGPDLGGVDEALLAQKSWPGGVQPVTPKPVLIVDVGRKVFSLTSQATGSSLMYSLQGCGQNREWYVYGLPVPVGSCTAVKAKAQRYGWKVSKMVFRYLGGFWGLNQSGSEL